MYAAKAGHIGGDLSCLNVMTALYFHVMNGLDPKDPKAPLRDRFVLSKGHCVESLYVTLEAKGYLKPEVLDTLGQFGSILSGHPTIEVPGIEVNSGALGHGLSIGVGMAIAAKMDQQPWHTYVMMGDGEQGEGSIYEAAMAANRYQLDNLVAIIDRNHLQKLMKYICKNGFEHHVAMCRTDVVDILQEAIETYLGWNIYVHE